MLRGIRAKFLFAFLAGAMAILAIAMFASFSKISSVYESIMQRTTIAEFNQIAGEISTLFSDTETLISTRVAEKAKVDKILHARTQSVPEFSYAVQDVKAEVIQITSIFPQVDSVYIFMQNRWFLGLSRYNTQILSEPSRWPSERVQQLLTDSASSVQVEGCLTQTDFPFAMDEAAYIMLFKSIYGRYGKSSYGINIKESAMADKYASFMKDGVRVIRILNEDGVVISSLDKSEIGTPLALLDGRDLTEAGLVNQNGLATQYTPLKEYGLVITNSIPTSVYTEELTEIRNFLLLIFGVGMIILSVFFSFWIKNKLMPISALRDGMHRAGQGDYDACLTVTGSDELSELTEYYNRMLSDLKALQENRERSEVELRERELAMLRNEINPHFLYNTLNTVKCMADLEGCTRVAECVMALGGIVAPLYKVRTPTWTLQEEMCLIGRYLQIMNIRYGNGIVCQEHIPEEFLEWQMMRFILQPIVENCIIHGFCASDYAGRIVISVQEQNGDVCIAVDDDGAGLPEQERAALNETLRKGCETGGVGIMNVSRRIALRYGAHYGIWLEASEYGGLRTCILLPKDGRGPENLPQEPLPSA